MTSETSTVGYPNKTFLLNRLGQMYLFPPASVSYIIGCYSPASALRGLNLSVGAIIQTHHPHFTVRTAT